MFTIENIGDILGEGFEAELETLRSDVKGAARFAEKTTRLAAFHAGADMMQTTCSAGIEEEHKFPTPLTRRRSCAANPMSYRVSLFGRLPILISGRLQLAI